MITKQCGVRVSVAGWCYSLIAVFFGAASAGEGGFVVSDAARPVKNDRATSAQIAVQWALAARPAVKISVVEEGWYRIGRDDLIAAGLSPQTDPRRLRLFADGEEVAIRISGESDGRLDPADAIEFYGRGRDSVWTDAQVYWLAEGSQRGKRVGQVGNLTGRISRIREMGMREAFDLGVRAAMLPLCFETDSNKHNVVSSGNATFLFHDERLKQSGSMAARTPKS